MGNFQPVLTLSKVSGVTIVATAASSVSPENLRSRSQAATLVLGKTKSPTAKLRSQNAVLFAQIFNRVLLLLIHPSGDTDKQKAKRIQDHWHSFAGYHRKVRRRIFRNFFNEIQFLDTTP